MRSFFKPCASFGSARGDCFSCQVPGRGGVGFCFWVLTVRALSALHVVARGFCNYTSRVQAPEHFAAEELGYARFQP